MRDLLKSVFKLSIPTALNFITSILRNKILALLTGTIGLGVYSQFMNLSNLANAIFPIGSLGLIKYISYYHEDKKMEEIGYFIKYFFLKNLFYSTAIILILI